MINSIFPTEVEQLQYFMQRPDNTTVSVGQTAIMRCIIGRQQGFAIWRINEIFLTLERLASFPRYKVIGNEESGEHFLRIENVTVQDQGKYECQAGRNGEQKAIRTFAQLTVIIPLSPSPSPAPSPSPSSSSCLTATLIFYSYFQLYCVFSLLY